MTTVHSQSYHRILCCILLFMFIFTSGTLSGLSKSSTPESISVLSQPTHVFFAPRYDGSFVMNYPRSTCPVFAEPNTMVTLSFTTESTVSDLFVQLHTAYEPVVDEFWVDILSIEETMNTYEICIQLPIDIPVELYNITIILDTNGEYTQYIMPRAVNVIDSLSDTFTFVHVTDLHVGDPRGFLQSIKETIGFRSIKQCIDEINLVDPDFVLISGDLCFGQLYPFEYKREYAQCFELLQRFNVPTFVTPGNHDGYFKFREDGLKIWQKYFGSLYYSFDIGDAHILAVNSYDWPTYFRRTILTIPLVWGGNIQEEQLNWIEQDLTHSTKNISLMFLHHNPLWDTKSDTLIRRSYGNREAVLTLIDNADVDMVLAGHVHEDNVTVVNDTIFLTTTTPESEIRTEDGYWGYRLITVDHGSILSYNYKEPKYSIPTYSLEVTHNSVFEAILTNALECTMDLSIPFLVPLGNYSVNQGTIFSERNNEFQKQLLVRVTVAADDSVSVFLTREDE